MQCSFRAASAGRAGRAASAGSAARAARTGTAVRAARAGRVPIKNIGMFATSNLRLERTGEAERDKLIKKGGHE